MVKVASLEKGIEVAAIAASMSSRDKHKTGAIITDRNNNVLSIGCNSVKTHPLQYYYANLSGEKDKIYLHAEISSIIKLKDTSRLPYRIYITRILANGKLSIAKPCPVCLAAIMETGIKEIVYTDKLGNIERILTNV